MKRKVSLTIALLLGFIILSGCVSGKEKAPGVLDGLTGSLNPDNGATSGGGGYSGGSNGDVHPDGYGLFVMYKGPVLPLMLTNNRDKVSVTRSLVLIS